MLKKISLKNFLIFGVIFAIFTFKVFADTEPNDTATTAESLIIGQEATGSVDGRDQNNDGEYDDPYDYYKIQFSTILPTWIMFDVTILNCSWVELKDATDSDLVYITENGTHKVYPTHTGGTFYIVVEYEVSESGTYTVKPWLLSDSYSGEPNQDISQAYSISTGTLQGYIWYTSGYEESSDIDYYKISTPDKTGIISLDLEMPSGKDYDVELDDGNGETLKIGNEEVGSNHETLEYFFSSAGDYYVKITGFSSADEDWSTDSPYTLTYSLKFDEGPGEPENNNMQGAYQLSDGSTINGYIFDYSGDPDWYKIVLSQSGSISLNLTMPAGKDYDIELYDNAGNWIIDGTQQEGTTTETVTYNANSGTYYVKICGALSNDYDRSNSYSLTYNFSATPAAVPSISLSKSSLSFSAVYGGSNPSNQTFTVTNNGESGSTLSWQASDNMSWLSLSPTSGSLSYGDSENVTVSVDITGLSTGTYSGTITISDANASNSPQTISVTLNVTAYATGGEGKVQVRNNLLNMTRPNQEVSINVNLSQSGKVVVKLYTLDGILIKKLFEGNVFGGTKTVTWDGKVDGSSVPSGIYYVHIEAPGISETKKICVVK